LRGINAPDAGATASKVKGVSKVLVADAPQYEGWLAENMARW
jgi:hypothetical protein